MKFRRNSKFRQRKEREEMVREMELNQMNHMSKERKPDVTKTQMR